MPRPKEFKLFRLAKKFGLRKILLSPDLWPAVIITIIVCILYLPSSQFGEMATSISITLIGADAGMLGIVLAGFAIMISLMHGTFKDILKDAGMYDNTVFLFTYDSMLVGLGLVFSVFFSVLIPVGETTIQIHTFTMTLTDICRLFFTLSMFFSTYGLFSVVWLLFHMRDLAMLRGELRGD